MDRMVEYSATDVELLIKTLRPKLTRTDDLKKSTDTNS